jgi:hypothetical protein
MAGQVVAAVIVAGITLHAQTPQRTASSAAAGPAKTATPYVPPKTPWGDPDLQGTYTNKDENGIPMERPNQFAGKSIDDVDDSEFAEIVRERQQRALASAAGIGGADTGAGPVHWYEHYNAKNSRAWLITDPEDGRIPALTAAGQKAADARALARKTSGRGPADSWEDRSLYDRCITRGVPGSMMPAIYGNAYDITQAPGVVAIRYEMIHETRVIPLDPFDKLRVDGERSRTVDDSPRPAKRITSYMGSARGHWEGNTLVVVTKNFNERGAYRNANPETYTLIERFTPIAPNKLQWSVTIDDTTTWTRPWTFAMNLTRDASLPLFEYGCHEGNYGLRNILSAARAEEKAAKEKAK